MQKMCSVDLIKSMSISSPNDVKSIINADLSDEDKRNEIEQEVLANIELEKFGFLYSACEKAADNLKETLNVNCQE